MPVNSLQDEQRIQELLLYGILDTPSEENFDDITALAARYFDVPIALITLVDRDRQWFKSRVGLGVTQTARDIAFCDTAIQGTGVMVVTDARSDARFASNPLVTGEPGIRFYAGSPLVTPQGHALGTLCIIDRRPRAFSAEQGDALTVLARQVGAHLELRRQKSELARALNQLRSEHERLKWARSQIEESDARMRLVLKGSNDGWWDRNLQTGRMFFSSRGWEMLGYDNEELPYDEQLWERLIFPEDLAATNERLADLLKSGVENYAVELRLLHKEGRPVPVLCRGYVLRDDAGRAIRMSGTNTDLTQSRAAERALRAEKELNEQIVRNSPIGICIYDGEGNCIIANDAIAEQVGATREQLRAQNLHQIPAWKSSGIYRQAIQTLETGEPSSRVVHFETSFGRKVWLSVSFRVLVTGDLGRLMLMTDDLSEFKVADAARREMQEAYGLLFSNNIDGVLQTRSDGAVVTVNPAACAMLDLPEAMVRARGLSAIVNAQDPRWLALLAERSRSGHARGEVTLLRGNGEPFEAELTTAAYEDREGRALISIMIRDITERQVWAGKLERSLSLLNNLAQRVPGVIYQFQMYPDGRSCFPFASDGLWTIYEVTPEEVREDAGPVFRRLHPDDAEAIVRSIAESAASLAPWNAEYRVLLPLQGLRWREGNAQPERLPDGSVLWHGCITDVTARKEAEASTHRLAYFDALTGLPNRAYLLDRVAQSLAASRRSGQTGALLFLDLDNFKHINDARGHSVGDALLCQVAKRLAALLRPADVVARLGGDEFVVLVNELGTQVDIAARSAMALAERIRAVLEQPYPIDGNLYSGTGSIGLTMFPKGADGVDDLLREADTAMYRAKSGGRNRIAYFEAAMQAEVEDRLAIEQDLKHAIGNGQLQVHVQPQFDAAGSETGGECLLRWTHPTRGAIAPMRFIPIAEDSGLIREIGEWVLRQACIAIAAFQSAGATDSAAPRLAKLSLSVNISPRQFRQDDFVERVARLLEETGAPGRCLIFEVTEGLLIDNWEAAAQRMREIALLGIRFSIDDFGTGYSSFAYLKQLPLHELKIDRSFVKDTPDDPNDTAIVRSILSVARILNLHVVAEGVETQAQADFLIANACDTLQGYLLARPMPMAAWMTRHGLAPDDAPDPYLWLEDVAGARALDWVKAHNAVSTERITQDPSFETTRAQIRAILDSSERIPYVTQMGDLYYNFWRDGQHPRGLWRRTSLAQYRTATPEWETVLDLDDLARTEDENWVWKGQQCRYPDWDRCLISLSRGGADAVVVREFDLPSKTFVSDGFQVPEAKSTVCWLDRDTLFVGTDFGAGSLTDSGYPRDVRLWRRGTPLASATSVFAGQPADVAVAAYVSQRPGYRREIILRSPSFFTGEYWLRESGQLSRIAIPDDAQLDFFGPQLLVQLRSDWHPDGDAAYKAGSLLAIDFNAFTAGGRDFQVLFVPSERTALDAYATTRTHVVLSILEDVKGRLAEWRFAGGAWQRRDVAAPSFGSLGVAALDHGETDEYFLTHVDFLTPDSLYLAQAGTDARARLKQRPAFFDAGALDIDQYEAVSRDGTRVPYFIVKPRDLVRDGSHPTLLYGYGGFEVSLTPAYPAAAGKAWLEKGGVYVVANIRGGGEFGPRWHAAALKDQRQNAYDDFIAVAQDLIGRGITRPARLGIMGGSNGGLLMGVMITQRPELFGAVVCQVPLLDMRRYNRLLAGASWMGEYGDPDDANQWAYIRRYSPYQNLRSGAAYPKILFTTSTRDDRVHPGHARKMMARMEELGVKTAWYYENMEGGHAGAADNSQVAFMNALEYTFLWEMLRA